MRHILIAAFNVVHDYGTDRIAELLEKTRGTVNHEVNPPAGSSSKLGLIDAAKITLATRDDRIVRAMAEACGFILVPMIDAHDADADVAGILARCSKMAQEFGETMATINQALVDGKITQNELDSVIKESDQLVTAINHLRTLLKAKAEADSAGRS